MGQRAKISSFVVGILLIASALVSPTATSARPRLAAPSTRHAALNIVKIQILQAFGGSWSPTDQWASTHDAYFEAFYSAPAGSSPPTSGRLRIKRNSTVVFNSARGMKPGVTVDGQHYVYFIVNLSSRVNAGIDSPTDADEAKFTLSGAPPVYKHFTGRRIVYPVCVPCPPSSISINSSGLKHTVDGTLKPTATLSEREAGLFYATYRDYDEPGDSPTTGSITFLQNGSVIEEQPLYPTNGNDGQTYLVANVVLPPGITGHIDALFKVTMSGSNAWFTTTSMQSFGFSIQPGSGLGGKRS